MRWIRRRPSSRGSEARAPHGLALYRPFVPRGGLVFDIGANIGERTSIFLALGARIVAVEPQSDCSARLRQRFGETIAIEQAAVGAEEGTADLLIASAHTISSLSPEWVAGVQESGRFSEHRWDEKVTVPVTTLDALIVRYGTPDFTKIDVEGYELAVLRGLSQPLPALSFEFDFELGEQRLMCVVQLLQRRIARAIAAGVGWPRGDQSLPSTDTSRCGVLRRRIRAQLSGSPAGRLWPSHLGVHPSPTRIA
jgi:FkbM family methyltransferase